MGRIDAALDIPHVMTGRALEQKLARTHENAWGFEALTGRMIELRGVGASSALTFAFELALQAQMLGEPVAWIAGTDSLFFPPDVARNGIDLEALALVRVKGSHAAARAADKLLRSGAFGLVVLDLGAEAYFAEPLQSRLVRLAEQHDAAVVCLTQEQQDARALGSLVSVRVEATRAWLDVDRFRCSLRATRDKRRSPQWHVERECRGTPGLR